MRRRHGGSAPITRFVRGSVAAHSRSARRLRSRPRRPRRPHASIGSEARSRETGNSPCRRPASAGGPSGYCWGTRSHLRRFAIGPFPLARAGARVRVRVRVPLGVVRMVFAAGALECSRGTLSVVPSNLRATSLQTDAHALVALAPAHVCARTAAHPCPHLRQDFGSPLPASAPGLQPPPAHICARTAAHPCPHLRQDCSSTLPTSASGFCPRLRVDGLQRIPARNCAKACAAGVCVWICFCVPLCMRAHMSVRVCVCANVCVCK
jgi:hypothetical protein